MEQILATITAFAGDTPQFDDIPLMILRAAGSGPGYGRECSGSRKHNNNKGLFLAGT